MSMTLTKDTELAERFGLDIDRFHYLRRRNGWPFVQLGRYDIRFTDRQVEQIVAAHSVTPKKSEKDSSGLTDRSASRVQAKKTSAAAAKSTERKSA